MYSEAVSFELKRGVQVKPLEPPLPTGLPVYLTLVYPYSHTWNISCTLSSPDSTKVMDNFIVSRTIMYGFFPVKMMNDQALNYYSKVIGSAYSQLAARVPIAIMAF